MSSTVLKAVHLPSTPETRLRVLGACSFCHHPMTNAHARVELLCCRTVIHLECLNPTLHPRARGPPNCPNCNTNVVNLAYGHALNARAVNEPSYNPLIHAGQWVRDENGDWQPYYRPQYFQQGELEAGFINMQQALYPREMFWTTVPRGSFSLMGATNRTKVAIMLERRLVPFVQLNDLEFDELPVFYDLDASYYSRLTREAAKMNGTIEWREVDMLPGVVDELSFYHTSMKMTPENAILVEKRARQILESVDSDSRTLTNNLLYMVSSVIVDRSRFVGHTLLLNNRVERHREIPRRRWWPLMVAIVLALAVLYQNRRIIVRIADVIMEEL